MCDARQDKTRQDKTRQDKTRQDKTRQDKTRQDKTRQDKLYSQCNTSNNNPCTFLVDMFDDKIDN